MNATLGIVEFPAMILHQDAVNGNAAAMAAYCESHGVQLAPHAKTHMSRDLCDLQSGLGAWGMTAATTRQVRTLHSWGVPRILHANVLVDTAAINWVAQTFLTSAEAAAGYRCYVDSEAGIELLEDRLVALGAAQPLRVLIELGYSGGRTGTRSVEAALLLAERVAASPVLALEGVAGFEGLIPAGNGDVRERALLFLSRIRETVESLHASGHFSTGAPIVTAGGSSYFDLVVEALGPEAFSFPVRTILRSGCSLIHDHGVYRRTSPLTDTRGSSLVLSPALELLASVLSRPEPGLAIVGFGRREAPTDDILPVVLRRHSGAGTSPLDEWAITAVNDHHAFLRVPEDAELAPGDVLGFGIGHPCGAFDRWRSIPVINSEGAIASVVEPTL